MDARTDIHALGVVYYELLAGRKAYTGDTVDQITNAVLANHPAPAHEMRSGVPPLLSAIAAKAMARDPGMRFSTAAAMAVELRRWIDRHSALEAPVQASMLTFETPSMPPPRLGRRRPRGQTAKVLAGLGLAAASAAFVALLAGRQGADPAPAPQAGTGTAQTVVATVSAPLSAPLSAPISAPISASLASPVALPADTPAPVTVTPAPATATPVPATATRSGPAAARPLAAPRTKTSAASRTAAATVGVSAATGTVQLAISPWGHVEVDGSPAGTTPPLTRLTLTEGSHTVTVRNVDFPPYTTTVQVQADKPLTVRHRFAP